MRHMHALGTVFAGERLGESAECVFAGREGGALRGAFEGGGGAREDQGGGVREGCGAGEEEGEEGVGEEEGAAAAGG